MKYEIDEILFCKSMFLTYYDKYVDDIPADSRKSFKSLITLESTKKAMVLFGEDSRVVKKIKDESDLFAYVKERGFSDDETKEIDAMANNFKKGLTSSYVHVEEVAFESKLSYKYYSFKLKERFSHGDLAPEIITLNANDSIEYLMFILTFCKKAYSQGVANHLIGVFEFLADIPNEHLSDYMGVDSKDFKKEIDLRVSSCNSKKTGASDIHVYLVALLIAAEKFNVDWRKFFRNIFYGKLPLQYLSITDLFDKFNKENEVLFSNKDINIEDFPARYSKNKAGDIFILTPVCII